MKEISSLNESLRVQNESLKRRVGELEAEVCVHSVLWVVTLQASSPNCEKETRERLARVASLAQIGELAGRLSYYRVCTCLESS